ncbi:flavin reductase family protein [Mangrovibacter sp. SLW1]
MKKYPYPVSEVRRFLEPGPIVLISSHWQGKDNIMTLGWQTVMEFSPSLIGCMISAGNHSFEMIKASRDCVINLPEVGLLDTVAQIGNCSGSETDKFTRFGLTPEPAQSVSAPAIAECFASFECQIYDDVLVDSYNFFIFEVVCARVKSLTDWPQTMHYTGDGIFRLDGEMVNRHQWFTKVS